MEYRSRHHIATTFTHVVRVIIIGFEKINPFMPRGDLLDNCCVNLSYFQNAFGMKHKVAKYLE